jgi:hypothetical protein
MILVRINLELNMVGRRLGEGEWEGYGMEDCSE